MENGAKFSVLDHGYVQLIESWGSDEAIIEAARMSVDKGFVSWEPYEGHSRGDLGLLSHLWNNKHTSPFEMAGLIIEVKAPIFVFREWHRHRTQSYNEMSTRYVPLPDENYVPFVSHVVARGNAVSANKQAQGAGKLEELDATEWTWELRKLYEHAQAVYEYGIKIGIPKELARLVVPVGRYSRMRASANLLNWLKFLQLRDHAAAQWEIREYAKTVGGMIAARFPRTFQLFNEGRLT